MLFFHSFERILLLCTHKTFICMDTFRSFIWNDTFYVPIKKTFICIHFDMNLLSQVEMIRIFFDVTEVDKEILETINFWEKLPWQSNYFLKLDFSWNYQKKLCALGGKCRKIEHVYNQPQSLYNNKITQLAPPPPPNWRKNQT